MFKPHLFSWQHYTSSVQAGKMCGKLALQCMWNIGISKNGQDFAELGM